MRFRFSGIANIISRKPLVIEQIIDNTLCDTDQRLQLVIQGYEFSKLFQGHDLTQVKFLANHIAQTDGLRQNLDLNNFRELRPRK